MNIFKGLIYCTKCGNRGPSKLVNLSLPCTLPTDYGLRNLAAINEGRLPEQLDKWPNDDNVPNKIDKATKRVCDVPDPYQGIRVKRPKSIPNPAGLSINYKVAPSISPTCRAEEMLPPFLLNLFELSALEGSGATVQWPEGINTQIAHAIIFDYFELMINSNVPNPDDTVIEQVVENHPVQNPSSSSNSQPSVINMSQVAIDNLEELLSLFDAGESVIWPDGLNAQSARIMLSNAGSLARSG